MALAIFDLDNTLIAGDSDYSWGEFLVGEGMVDAAHYREKNEKFYQDYQHGNLDIREYLAFALEPLARLTPEVLAGLHRKFMTEVIRPMWLPAAVRLLQKHRQQGDFLLVITSTNRFVVEPICAKLGVDDLLATELAVENHRYNGEVAGEPTFREGKVSRLKSWLETTGHSMAGSYFYSDSINDLPLLEVVEKPVAVDPDSELAEIARQRQWPVISLRQADQHGG
jgi:HAD superfamily hydrolase (TIGR01490 family)